MFKNYFKVAIRNFKRQYGYTTINILGLAVGLACCLLIFLYVQLEINYDQFHKKSNRIYRIATDITQSGQTRELAWSSPPLAKALLSDFPEVEQAVRIYRQGGTVRRDNESEVVNIHFVDSTFFDVFDFELTQGNPQTALNDPGSIIITQEQANQFFKNDNPLHQTITYEGAIQLEVTGVLADIPSNSHFQPEFLANLQTLPQNRFQQWQGINLWTYIVLNENSSGGQLESKFPDFIKSKLGQGWAQIMTLHLQPLTSIYFESDRLPEIGPTGDFSYVFIFSGIGLFVLIIACINFINLATAQSFRRAREVGVKKVLGAHRSQLIRQFLSESILMTFIAMAFALIIAQLALPLFGELSGYELSRTILLQADFIVGLIAISLLVGVLSGSYPALVLSMFKPSAVLSGNVDLGKSNTKISISSNFLRRGLVVAQFGISIILLVSTGIVSSQLNFIQNKNLGFNKERVVVIRLNENMRNNYDALKQNFLSRSNILQVGASSQVPGIPIGPQGYRPEGMTEGEVLTNTFFIDESYLNTMEIELLEGREFSLDRPSELEQGFIINESAASHFGWAGPKEALEKSIQAVGQNGVSGKVIGIVKDFNYESLHTTVKPLVLRYRERQNFLSLRIAGNQISDTMEEIEEQWASVVPGEPFVSWFLDDQLQDQYEAEARMDQLFTYFSVIAIIIACMGLFGLSSFSIQKRTKEIGIRKILGASLSRILVLLTKEYSLMLILANAIAWPLGYIIMVQWLENFAYQTSISLQVFLFSGAIVFTIALLSVGFHCLKAAKMNPVKSLRSE